MNEFDDGKMAAGEVEQAEALFNPDEFGVEALEDAAEGSDVFAPIAANRASAGGNAIRITRVRLANILGFRKTEVYPEKFSVLVGANNSGKSSLMRAVNFAQTLMRVHVETSRRGWFSLEDETWAISFFPSRPSKTCGTREFAGWATSG